MSTVTNLLQAKWHALNTRYRKYLQLGMPIVVMGFVLIMLLVLFHQDAKLPKLMMQMENKRTALVTEQIGSMRAQIDKLAASTQDSMQSGTRENGLSVIEKDVTGLAKSNELQKIAADMEAHLDNLEKTVSANGHTKQYLDPQSLPFQVISIDVISQQPFVSVAYENHIMPLGLGDSLAGWKVIGADYAAVEAEFQNNQGQYIKVNTPDKIKPLEEKE